MSKIDYTNEYHNLLDAIVDGSQDKVIIAAQALGLEFNSQTEIISLFVKMLDRFDIGGNSAETATCYLKEEFCI